jgi:V-type H+-transporting ATPase subunit A
MLRNIVLFYNLAQKAVEQSSVDRKVTWNQIKSAISGPLYQLTRMKFQDPHDGEQALVSHFKSLSEDIVAAFRNLGEE